MFGVVPPHTTVMALLSRERHVINSTICWSGLKTGSSLFNNKKSVFAQSAGNRNYSSSLETIRGSSFSLFRETYLTYFGKPFLACDNWLYWLIGFIEGDGCIFIQESRSALSLIITQKDPKVLNEIAYVLGFGVVKHYNEFSRFKVGDKHNCFLIYCLLNGFLFINSRILQLSKWTSCFLTPKFKLASFNLKTVPMINLTPRPPLLTDGWLSGFTDAEGCFNVTIDKNGGVRCRFILDQKDSLYSLNLIRILFDNDLGSVSLRSGTNGVYRYCLGLTTANLSTDILISYFNNYQLKTTKHKAFSIICEILLRVSNKSHKTESGLIEIYKLKRSMNLKFYKTT